MVSVLARSSDPRRIPWDCPVCSAGEGLRVPLLPAGERRACVWPARAKQLCAGLGVWRLQGAAVVARTLGPPAPISCVPGWAFGAETGRGSTQCCLSGCLLRRTWWAALPSSSPSSGAALSASLHRYLCRQSWQQVPTRATLEAGGRASSASLSRGVPRSPWLQALAGGEQVQDGHQRPVQEHLQHLLQGRAGGAAGASPYLDPERTWSSSGARRRGPRMVLSLAGWATCCIVVVVSQVDWDAWYFGPGMPPVRRLGRGWHPWHSCRVVHNARRPAAPRRLSRAPQRQRQRRRRAPARCTRAVRAVRRWPTATTPRWRTRRTTWRPSGTRRTSWASEVSAAARRRRQPRSALAPPCHLIMPLNRGQAFASNVLVVGVDAGDGPAGASPDDVAGWGTEQVTQRRPGCALSQTCLVRGPAVSGPPPGLPFHAGGDVPGAAGAVPRAAAHARQHDRQVSGSEGVLRGAAGTQLWSNGGCRPP